VKNNKEKIEKIIERKKEEILLQNMEVLVYE